MRIPDLGPRTPPGQTPTGPGALPEAAFAVTADGRIQYDNPEAERLFGVSDGDASGRRLENLLPGLPRSHRPGTENHSPHGEAADVPVSPRHGAPGGPEPRPDEPTGRQGLRLPAVTGRRADGTEFLAEVRIAAGFRPPDMPPPRVSGSRPPVVTVRETCPSRVEESFLPWLLTVTPDAVVVADKRGRIVLTNSRAERLFGYPAAELVGLGIESLVPDAARDRHRRLRESFDAHPTVREMGIGLRLRWSAGTGRTSL